MHDFAGKVALVMGAACPPEIGRAAAVRLARAGADVACADRVEIGHPDSACASPEALDASVAAVRAEGQAALRLEADVADAAQVNEAVERCAKELGRLDALHRGKVAVQRVAHPPPPQRLAYTSPTLSSPTCLGGGTTAAPLDRSCIAVVSSSPPATIWVGAMGPASS